MSHCDFSAGINDKKCDDGNNIFECNWDGGDCCVCFIHKGFCTHCQCMNPDATKHFCCKIELMANGLCDGVNNNIDCQYDALDCCSDLKRPETVIGHQCPLQTSGCPMQKLINSQCDSVADKADCLYDMGQCCNESLAMKSENGRICDINSRGTVLYY